MQADSLPLSHWRSPLTETAVFKDQISTHETLRWDKEWTNKIRMDLEVTILSEVSQRKTNIMISLVCEILKNDTNELIYKTKTDS